MLLKGAAALLGPELAYKERVDIRTEGGAFAEVARSLDSRSGERVLDCRGLLASPGLVNCHTHLGDSIAKDVASGTGVDERVHPVFGVKSRVLDRTDPAQLAAFMEASCRSMLAGGTTTFADFREGGASGARLLRRACSAVPLRAVILGRIGVYQDEDQIRANHRPRMAGALDGLLEHCDGVGISGANEHSDAALAEYSRTPKLRAIHAAETDQSVRQSLRITGRGEVERALLARPHFLVHMTRATARDLEAASGMSGVVACPRANLVLGGVMPDLRGMLDAGCTVALGTDNVMVNSPNMFREMEFAWKGAGGGLAAVDVLRMATVNGGRVLGMDIGVIREGAAADYMLLEWRHADVYMAHDPHAALVHRAGPGSIRAVAVAGRIVHGAP